MRNAAVAGRAEAQNKEIALERGVSVELYAFLVRDNPAWGTD